jgi:hypothetical protein
MSDNSESDDLAKELDPILDSYAEPKQSDDKNEERSDEFLQRFESIKVQIIKHVMEQIGKYLEKKGHAYSISERIELYYRNPSITMEIYPKAPPDVEIQEHEFPKISFIAEPDIQAIGIQVQDGMPGRPGLVRGHVTSIDSLTKEYIMNQIITVLRMNFVTQANRKPPVKNGTK